MPARISWRKRSFALLPETAVVSVLVATVAAVVLSGNVPYSDSNSNKAMPIWRALLTASVWSAFLRWRITMGAVRPARAAIMPITTRSSTRVKPRGVLWLVFIVLFVFYLFYGWGNCPGLYSLSGINRRDCLQAIPGSIRSKEESCRIG